jgi:hypothetical protein
VIPVHQFMPQALAAMLRNAPDCPEKIDFAWRAAVGTAIANVTKVELKGRVVYVQAKGPEWRREIERSGGIIRSRLNALLGEDAVRGLNVTLS